MKLKSFLDKYSTVIFDLDGVITDESVYWDAAALVVYQELNAKELFRDAVDISYYMSNIKNIRKEVFVDDKLIAVLKNKGVNSNWDLTYVTLGIALILNTKDFTKVLEYAENMDQDVFKEYDILARRLEEKLGIPSSRSSKFWDKLKMRFQEWILGDELFKNLYGYEVSQKGKPGILMTEEPLLTDRFKDVLKELKAQGKRLCTATGRVFEEVEPPLTRFGVYEYFAKDGICNFNDVTRVQKEFGVAVTKPHGYMCLKALYGTDFSDKDILDGNYDKEMLKTALMVGDAGADILCAKSAGIDFCAVLTGVTGKAGKAFFEEIGADYIIDSILDFEDK